MVIVAGKTVDFQSIAGFLMGLKPDIISIYQRFEYLRIFLKNCNQARQNFHFLTHPIESCMYPILYLNKICPETE